MSKNVAALKAVVIGKQQVGKTSLISTYLTGEFPQELPPQATQHEYSCEVEGLSLVICDSVRSEKDHRIRPLTYPSTDVFLLLFDVTCSEGQFRDLLPKWWVELKFYCPTVPVILVGSKVDLRENIETISAEEGEAMAGQIENGDIETISAEEGEAMAAQIGAVQYIEVSCCNKLGVRQVFDEAIRVGLSYQSNNNESNKRVCEVL